MNYQGLLDFLRDLDSDADYALDEEKFIFLLQAIPICNNPFFAQITYNSLRDEKTGRVSFRSIKELYVAAFHGIKTRKMSVILFRGVDNERKMKIDFDHFWMLGKALGKSDKTIRKLFKRRTWVFGKHIRYWEVARILFGIAVYIHRNIYEEW